MISIPLDFCFRSLSFVDFSLKLPVCLGQGSRALRHFRRRVDYSEYGGAPLLGLKGIAIVGHGRSGPKAVRNAVAMAYRFAADRFIDRLQPQMTGALSS